MNMLPMISLPVVLAAVCGTSLSAFAQTQPAASAPVTPMPVATTAATITDLAAKLPSDSSLVTGKLDNGLSYVLKKHPNPEGRVSLWLHVSTGSLNELEPTRGIAHFLEHMAFNGSKNFPPGSVIDFFQSLGLQFGRDQNAFTSFDQTTYQLALPDTKPETVDKALTFMSDVGGRLLLNIEEIDSERGIILEERRTRLSAQQRVQEQLLLGIAPESTFGRRLPIGTPETIMSMTREDFVKFYAQFYVPSNMTLIVVGDYDVATSIPQITKAFGDLKKADQPSDLPVGVKARSGQRGLVITDKELTQASISVYRVEPARAPTTTVSMYRADLVETIGQWALNRRISAQLNKGGMPYLGASASSQDIGGAVHLAVSSANGKTESWRAMLTQLGVDIQRARLHGFTELELKDAREALISQAEEAAKRESTTPARGTLARINGAIANREPIMSAAQRLDLLKTLLPTITASEVGAKFAAEFDPANVAFVLEAPTGGDVPSESELAKLGAAAFSVKPEKMAEEARTDSLMSTLPTPGKAVETATHEPSAVTSWWLDNGVRFHHRSVDKPKGEASIIISITGGEINETAANRGITQVAGLAFSKAATSKLSSTQIRDFMTAKKVRVGGGGGADTFTLSVSGDVESLETGMQLAHLLLTDPAIEQAAFDQWAKQQEQMRAMLKSRPEGILAESIPMAMLTKDEPRQKMLTADNVTALTREAGLAWLKGALKDGAIEVAAVGDISKDAAAKLVLQYIGSLPKRERISATTLADKRKLGRNVGPIGFDKTMETATDKAIVMDGFTGADVRNPMDVRHLQMASRILSTRMIKVLREEKRLVYSIGAQSVPATAYEGSGMFMASAPTDPANAAELPKALEELYAEFAKNGPTEEEMTTARLQLVNLLTETMKEPGFWSGRLANLEYRGNKLDDLMSAIDYYKVVPAKAIQDGFNKFYKPANRFTFIVKPAAGGSSDKPAESMNK